MGDVNHDLATSLPSLDEKMRLRDRCQVEAARIDKRIDLSRFGKACRCAQDFAVMAFAFSAQ